jgi:metal-responsive CopG/Arc/MetJ family transcriptional regulator
MKVKTSITLAPEVLEAVDRVAGSTSSRSEVIELAIREFLITRARAKRDARDVELINKFADELEVEMADVRLHQIEP